MKTVLSIAGSDSCGGAGIQADIKTITAHGLYAETAVTAVTAQNTVGVQGIVEMDPEFVARQIRSCFEDIRPDAVKIGMVGTAAAVKAIAEELQRYDAKNIVVDPVLQATTGASLADDDVAQSLMEYLVPIASIVTPNIPEAALLTGRKVSTPDEMEEAASVIKAETKGAVLIKGGHASGGADDLLLTEHLRVVWLRHKRINTQSTHGTGCTMSASIACGLARDYDTQAAVSKAKAYVTGALENAPGLGSGVGPLNHMWDLQ
ncbi:MAG: bifunctional hydroxymethylpyrimidine kinase/phosphomethylpyrimidine kinase [Eggerthellaceae bacterium]|jgi:hydroxymethylpyrimidine/phosphomethylpyrimidine kinase